MEHNLSIIFVLSIVFHFIIYKMSLHVQANPPTSTATVTTKSLSIFQNSTAKVGIKVGMASQNMLH